MAQKRLDLRKIIPGLDGSTKLMDGIERVAMQEWKAASRGLGETRDDYRRAISVDTKTSGKLRFTLRGMVPNIVEQGMGPGGVGTYGAYDIRKFMKFSGKPYVNVMFRQKKSSQSPAVQKKMGRLAISRSKVNPAGGPDRGFIYGRQTTKNIGPRFPAGMAPVRRNPTTGKKHSTDFLADMIRVRAAGTSPGSGTSYMTFRRISKNGKPWISRGVRPRRFGAKVAKKLPGLIGPIFAALIRGSR